VTERSTSDLVFRPDGPRRGPGCDPDTARLREELANLQHACQAAPRVVPAARDPAATDEPAR